MRATSGDSVAPHQPSGRRWLGFLLALATMLLWSVLPLALKITLTTMDAYTITWYRFLASALILGAALAYRRKLPALHTLGAHPRRLLGVATVFLAVNYVCYLAGLDHTSAVNSTVLIQMAPLLLAVGGLWVFGERFARTQWLGFGLLLIGVGTFVRDQLGPALLRPGEYYLGSALILLAAVTWAIYGLAQKQLLRWLPSEAIMVCIYVGCAVLLTPFSSPTQLLRIDGLALTMLAFCALNTVVAYGTFAEALSHLEASRVAAVLALTPVATIVASSATRALWPNLSLGPNLSSAGLLGAGFVVLGSLLTSLGQQR
jgi:drug/metabolite transporter (DMT)-like permease